MWHDRVAALRDGLFPRRPAEAELAPAAYTLDDLAPPRHGQVPEGQEPGFTALAKIPKRANTGTLRLTTPPEALVPVADEDPDVPLDRKEVRQWISRAEDRVYDRMHRLAEEEGRAWAEKLVDGLRTELKRTFEEGLETAVLDHLYARLHDRLQGSVEGQRLAWKAMHSEVERIAADQRAVREEAGAYLELLQDTAGHLREEVEASLRQAVAPLAEGLACAEVRAAKTEAAVAQVATTGEIAELRRQVGAMRAELDRLPGDRARLEEARALVEGLRADVHGLAAQLDDCRGALSQLARQGPDLRQEAADAAQHRLEERVEGLVKLVGHLNQGLTRQVQHACDLAERLDEVVARVVPSGRTAQVTPAAPVPDPSPAGLPVTRLALRRQDVRPADLPEWWPWR